MKKKDLELKVIYSYTIRDIISQVNENKITKDSIVSLLKDRDQFILVYYGESK